ncbi:MAG: DUF1648 domain-containing protein [Saprospiraceae bacterium]|nr:DUF1648 domain-containing protein [Saprospiraceae bacterium]
MEQRIIVDLNITLFDRLIEALGWITIMIIWILLLANYSTLPENIPTHFNYLGKADDYGAKGNLFILPVIGTVIVSGLTILNRYPHKFNYLVKITERNAIRQYTLATRLIRYLKLNISILFGFIFYKTIQISMENDTDLGMWFLVISLGTIFIPIIYFILVFKRS